MRFLKFTLPVIALYVFFTAQQASALTLTPIRVEIQGDPGQTLVRPITLINEQNTTITYYSSFANFEAQGETGNPAFVDPKSDLGTWMSTDEAITLGPKETKTIDVTIAIPKDAYAGGHFAVVFFGTQPNKVGANNGVGIGAKTGTLILLSVSGDVKEGGGLASYNTKDHKFFYTTLPIDFQYRFKNDGNDRVKPQGNITMHDLFYIPETRIDANPVTGNILPHSTRMFDVEWVKHPRGNEYIAPTNPVARFFDDAWYEWRNYAFGPYMATLELVYGSQNIVTTEHVFFFVFPWQMLICLAVILFIAFWGGRKLLRRYNAYIIKKARASSH